MSVRLRDEAVVLEPATKTDRYTEEPTADWDVDPLSATPARFQGEPVSSTEEVLTATTVISRHRAFLEPLFDGLITPAWRIRWDGVDYEIDGDIGRRKSGRSVRFLVLTLKRVDG